MPASSARSTIRWSCKPPGEVNAAPPHSLDLLDGIDATRLQARLGLLKILENHDRAMQRREAPRATAGLEQFREQAFRMLMSPEARGAFDLNQESDKLRDRYGRNEYGESFLLARRLVEAGVRLVTVVWMYICPTATWPTCGTTTAAPDRWAA